MNQETMWRLEMDFIKNMRLSLQFSALATVGMSLIVFALNISEGYVLATTSGLKQAAHTAMFSYPLAELTAYLAIKYEQPYRNLSAMLIVAFLTLLVAIAVSVTHLFIPGTGNGFLSIWPSIVLTIPGNLWLIVQVRKKNKGP